MIREDRELFAALGRVNSEIPTWALRAMSGETTTDDDDLLTTCLRLVAHGIHSRRAVLMGEEPPAGYGCCGLTEEDAALALAVLTAPPTDADDNKYDDARLTWSLTD